mmetsp:Transcript_17315/g.54405  ORF Transcript_17315/g.54405 Transcript_17315/m.54405 type:complete len:219 (+) Transcript_17315:268-924(+)
MSCTCAAVAKRTPGSPLTRPRASESARTRAGVPATKVCMPRQTTFASPDSFASCRTWSSRVWAYCRGSKFFVRTNEKSFVSMQYGKLSMRLPLSWWSKSYGTSSSTKSRNALIPAAAAISGVRSVTEKPGVSHVTGRVPRLASSSSRHCLKAASSSWRVILALPEELLMPCAASSQPDSFRAFATNSSFAASLLMTAVAGTPRDLNISERRWRPRRLP